MRILEAGNVGIGTTNPSAKFHVDGSTAFDGSNTVHFRCAASQYGRNQLKLIGRYEASNDAWSATGARNAIMFKYQTSSTSAYTDAWTIQSFPNGTSNDLGFLSGTNNTPRVTFRGSNGNVGIGTTDPGYRLHVDGSSMFTNTVNIVNNDTNAYAHLEMGGTVGAYIDLKSPSSDDYDLRLITTGSGGSIQVASSGDAMTFNSSGNVGINATSPTYRLHVGGDIYATGNITAYSDRRAKSNIEKIENPLEKINKISGYTYTMKTEDDIDKRYTGLIAQEVLEILPEAVMGSEESQYSLAYGNMVGILVEAIKELKMEIDELKRSK